MIDLFKTKKNGLMTLLALAALLGLALDKCYSAKNAIKGKFIRSGKSK